MKIEIRGNLKEVSRERLCSTLSLAADYVFKDKDVYITFSDFGVTVSHTVMPYPPEEETGSDPEPVKKTPKTKPAKEKEVKTCVCQREGCGKTFVPKKPWQKFCSDECRIQTIAEKRKAKRAQEKTEPKAEEKAPVETKPEPPKPEPPKVIKKPPVFVRKCEVCLHRFDSYDKEARFCPDCVMKLGTTKCEKIAEANRANSVAVAKVAASKKMCVICDMPFNSTVGSKFCPDCVSQFGEKCEEVAEEAAAQRAFEREQARKKVDTSFKVCPRCGHDFRANDPDQMFCDRCTEKINHPKKKRR